MKTFFSLLLLSLFFIPASAQVRGKTTRIKLYASSSELRKLRASGVDFDHGFYDAATETFINEFDAEVVKYIGQLGYKYDVLVEDVSAYTDSINKVESRYKYKNAPVKNGPQLQALKLNFTTSCQSYDTYISTPPSFTYGSMGGFYNLAELDAQLTDMATKFPSLVSRFTIGTTLLGKPVWGIKISDNAATDEDEPELLYTGMHHSREGMSMMNLIYYMRYLLDNYSTNQAVKDIVDNRELYFVPVVNVDGFNYNTTASNWNASRRMRRKNMQETTSLAENGDGSGGDGVDINRNYGTYWGLNYSNGNTASSDQGNSDSYRGVSAFSEVESQNMKTFVNSRQFKLAINYHCYGNWWIRPQGPDSTKYSGITLSPSAISTYGSIGSLFTKYNCFVYGSPLQTVYDVNGYSDDWLFSDPSHSPIYCFSPEIGTSTDGFWCPQSKIEPYAKELIFPNLQAAYTAGSYAELQDVSDVAVSSTSGTFNFTVVRKGLTDGPITVSLVPVTGIQSVGTPVTINSISNFGGVYSGSISYTLPSNTPAGTLIQFQWQLQTGGTTITETVSKLYNPTVVFTDDMETSGNFSTKWATARKNSPWAYSAGKGYGNTASLSESPTGDYALNTNEYVQLATPLNLSGATKAYLSYQVKYTTANCEARLQVELSVNGGTYTAICTPNTIKESGGSLGGTAALTGSTDGWIRELVDLSSYAGNTSVGLRFHFLSSATTWSAYSKGGFDIDNVQIVKANAVILPVRFEDLVAIRKDATVQLKWKAHVDGSFSHYDIERSENGKDFYSIGRVTVPAATDFSDLNPVNGSNYYRIKAVDKDQSYQYSKTALVVLESNHGIVAYPNPYVNEVTFEVSSSAGEEAIVELFSVDGKLVYNGRVILKEGLNRHTIPMTAYPNHLYMLRIRNNAGNELATFKLIKKVN